MRAQIVAAAVVVISSALSASACLEAQAATPAPAPPKYDAAFWQTWGDGQGELAGYVSTRERYGELRKGQAVTVTVTEPWSTSTHVKADEGKHPPGDVIQVLKLNMAEDFQTGVYDYNMMTSSWIALQAAPGRPAGAHAKISFSAQEWCGHAWGELNFDARGAAEIVRSYFDGESGARNLENPPGGVVEDALLLWARGLASPVVARGASVDVPFLPSTTKARLTHRPLAWGRATLARDAKTQTVTVPAGTFEVERALVKIGGGDGGAPARTVEIFVEAAAPHRIMKLTSTDGTSLALTGSVRTPYWEKHREGDEALLAKLGLPLPARPASR